MGLWEYCFEQFRYPSYQFDKQFDGCHHVFSQEYYVIREWLLPGWLMVVQGFVTMSLLLSFIAQITIVMILIRWPLAFVLRYEWILSSTAFLCDAIAGKRVSKKERKIISHTESSGLNRVLIVHLSVSGGLLFLAVSIFGGQCWRRDWLMYPNFNHLSWSYGLAVISFMFHTFAACFLYLDARTGYRLRKESRNLVMQMQPNPQSHHAPQLRGGYI